MQKRTIDNGVVVLVPDGYDLYRVTDAITGRRQVMLGRTTDEAILGGYNQMYWDCAISGKYSTKPIPDFILSAEKI